MPPSRRRGWQTAGVALLGGAATALALPPLDLTPFLFGHAVLLAVIARSATPGSAALYGWLWALGFHVAGLHWIANAMLVNAASHAWLIPFANLGLPALLAGFTAAAAYLARRAFGAGIPLWLGLCALMAAAEWVRGHVATGFPWNLPIAVLDGHLVFLQLASLVGAFGVSVLVLLVSMLPALWLDRSVAPQPRRIAALAMAVTVIAAGAWGGWRMAQIPTVDAAGGAEPGVVVRIVQGNVPQAEKWNPLLKPRHMRRYLDLSRSGTAATVRSDGIGDADVPTVVVWPETAVAQLIGDDPADLRALSVAAPPGGSLVFGAPRVSRHGPQVSVHNSLFAVSSGGAALWQYDKAHLVPFGEYVPFRSILALQPIVQSRRDFTPGPGPRTLAVAGAPPVSPLICYEAIFPGAATDRDHRPRWLLNATNDAWFGRYSGPHQHLAIARLRAIEEGLPLVRAANTGVSAVIDPAGRIVARLETEQTGSIDSLLPAARPATVFSVFQDLPFSLMVVSLLLIAAYTRSGIGRRTVRN